MYYTFPPSLRSGQALLLKANLSSHLNLSQLQKERRRSLAGARDDRYVVDYQVEETAIRK